MSAMSLGLRASGWRLGYVLLALLDTLVCDSKKYGLYKEISFSVLNILKLVLELMQDNKVSKMICPPPLTIRLSSAVGESRTGNSSA